MQIRSHVLEKILEGFQSLRSSCDCVEILDDYAEFAADIVTDVDMPREEKETTFLEMLTASCGIDPEGTQNVDVIQQLQGFVLQIIRLWEEQWTKEVEEKQRLEAIETEKQMQTEAEERERLRKIREESLLAFERGEVDEATRAATLALYEGQLAEEEDEYEAELRMKQAEQKRKTNWRKPKVDPVAASKAKRSQKFDEFFEDMRQIYKDTPTVNERSSKQNHRSRHQSEQDNQDTAEVPQDISSKPSSRVVKVDYLQIDKPNNREYAKFLEMQQRNQLKEKHYKSLQEQEEHLENLRASRELAKNAKYLSGKSNSTLLNREKK